MHLSKLPSGHWRVAVSRRERDHAIGSAIGVGFMLVIAAVVLAVKQCT